MRYLKQFRSKRVYIIFLCAVFFLFKIIILTVNLLTLPKGKIVFAANLDGDDEIYTMYINGTGLKQLTHNEIVGEAWADSNDSHPSFSVDGQMISFLSGRLGKEKVNVVRYDSGLIGRSYEGSANDAFIMNSDGSNQRALTYDALVPMPPFFSPDGKKVIFSTHYKDEWQTRIVDVRERDQRIISTNFGRYVFSPDGRVYDTFEDDISSMDQDGANRIRLTGLLPNGGFSKGYPHEITNITFSQGGEKVIFVVENYIKRNNSGYDLLRFFQMNKDGSDLQVIHEINCSKPDKNYHVNPQKHNLVVVKGLKFLPDQTSIIFIAEFYSTNAIYKFDLKKRKVQNLTGKRRWRALKDFTFTPDGKKIVFIADIYPFNIPQLFGFVVYFTEFMSRFRKTGTSLYDNQYICLVGIDGRNLRRATKLPMGAELGRDFIHWEEDK